MANTLIGESLWLMCVQRAGPRVARQKGATQEELSSHPVTEEELSSHPDTQQELRRGTATATHLLATRPPLSFNTCISDPQMCAYGAILIQTTISFITCIFKEDENYLYLSFKKKKCRS